MTTAEKIPLTMRALIQRINRKLKAQHKRLQTCRRNSPWRGNLGDLYILDTSKNAVTRTHVDMVELASEMGLIQPFERLAD